MKRILSALLFVLLAVAPATAQYTLPGVYSPGVPGAGIDCDAGACLGRYVKFATVSGDDLTLTYQDANNAQQTLTFSGGLVTGGSLHTTTQELTLTLSGGTSVIIDLSGLTTAAEVSTAINLALSGYAQTADIEAFARVATTDTVPASRLAPGGTSGELLTRTSSGQSWITFSGSGVNLTQAHAEDDTDTTFGAVSGERLGQAIVANVRTCPDPSTGSDGQVCAVNNTVDAYELVDQSGGLNQTEVDARIAPYGRVSPSGTIPLAQLPAANALDSELPATGRLLPLSAGNGQVVKWNGSIWAAADDETGTAGSGEANVQVDWNVTDTGSDAYILNKPTISGGLSAVASNSTLEGDGTAGDPLGIADNGVGTSQLADDAVTQAKLANNSVHAPQIGANAVDSSEIAANAVGTSELNADAVTEAKIADSAVGHDQLASNSVRVDEIQANAVGHSEMADAAVGVVELRDDAAERLCPDPGTGTSGQVCARNAAGDAYELVTQSGGGGGGTDDQTAAEVPVTATGFSGNLSGTDTDVQTALATIDGFTLGGGGSGGTASVVAFKCALTDIASASYSSDTQILECEATPSINEGVFVVEDASGTDTTDRVVIPETGLYELIVSLYVDNGTGTRTTPHVSFTVETGGVVTTLDDEGTGYIRGSQGGQDEGAVDHTSIVELLADDRIGLVVRQEGTPNITIEGAQSFLAIVKVGGAVGAPGPPGPPGDDGTGIGDITAVNTSGTSGLAGGAASGDVDLRLHINGLANTTITGPDQIAFSDASDSHASKRVTQAGLGTHMAGSGLDVSATGQLGLDINELPALSNLAGADLVGVSDADDSHTDKRSSLAALAAHLAGPNLTASANGVLSATTPAATVTANPGTAAANDDLFSLAIGTTDYNTADEAARAGVDALEDLVGYSGRQELHARPPLPVEELTGNHNLRVRALGYVDGLLYGFTSEAAGGSVNGTDLLNSRDPEDGGAVGLTPETTPETLNFFLNGTTLYAQNFAGGGSETTFNTTTIRTGVPYALSTYPDENGKLYMLIDAGDVYVEELDYNAAGTITHAETVAQITPAILNTFAAFGGYEDETDVVSDNGGSGGDASGITDIYVAGDFAWFLVTYAEDAAAGSDFNYIARFARTDSAITAPATVTDADLIETGIRSNANQNSLIALATDGGILTDLFVSRASNPIIDHFTNSRLGDYEDLANRPDELTTANVEDATSEIFGLVSGERLEEHTLNAVPDVPVYFDGNMHGDPFDPNNPLGPNVVEFESDSHLNIQYHTDASTTNAATQEIKGNIYTSGDRTFHITSVDVWSGYVLNRSYHVHLAVVDTANSDQITAVYPSSTRYLAPSNGRSGVFKHQYTWGSVGIEIPPNTDFAILLGPIDNQGSTVIRSGAQASDSPTESSADASDDITYVSPATHSGFALHVNNSLTRPGNGFVLGDMKVYYHTTLGGILSQAEIEVRNAGVVVDVDNANDAVDGINFDGGLEAVRDTSEPNIPIVRIEDLGVSTDKMAADSVTNAKLADDAVALANLDADLTERICPDPGTGSSGQVCARNTAGTAYELVTPSGGGGGGTGLTEDQATDETDTTLGTVSGELLAAAVAEFESAGGGGGGGGGGYGDWASIGSVTGSISGNPVTVALNANETIDDYEELYLHIEANNANDQRVASGRFRVSDVPTTTLAGGGLGIPFAGNATDEGAVLVRRNADGDSLVLDVFGSVINFPATAVTSIYARELTAGGGGGGTDDQTAAEVTVDTTNFSRNLTSADSTVQDALETIDGFTQYQGAWQQASWPAGVIVTRSGIAYLSLVNNNTEIPTPAAEGWSGLPEGYIYRGEAPVVATVYNYGHIVFSPDTENYYFFTSTISASVARADIPTHANFSPVSHKLTNAEATDDLSTVYGSVTGELIAGAVAAHEDVANSVALTYTQNTGNLSLTVGRTIGANLSTQAVLPTLTQTQVEDETSTVPGLVTGERLSQAVAEFATGGGGGGGGDTARIVLLGGETYSPGAARNFDFTEDIPARHLLTFEIVGTATGYAIMLSDDLLALTAQSGSPSTSANSYPMYTRNHSNSLPTQNQGNSWLVWREDADSIYFRESRGSGGTMTITATPLGGGLSTSEQQELVNESRLVDTEIISSTNALTTTATSTPMDSVPRDTFDFATIAIEDFERIDIGLELDGTFDFVVPIRISRQMLLDIPTTPADLYPDGGTTTRRLEAVYWSGRVSAGINSEIGTAVTRPLFDWVDSRRNNGIESLSIAFTKNIDGDISQMHTYASSDVTMRMRYAVIRHYE